MSDVDDRPNKSLIWAGALSFVCGFTPFLAMCGILPRSNDVVDHSTDWLGWLVCAMFMAAGAIVILRGFLNGADETRSELPASAPIVLRAVHDGLVVLIVVGLAVVLSWTAFGPGARNFSVSVGGLSTTTAGSGDMIGRAAFGLASILGWVMVWMVLVSTARRWRLPA